MKRKNCWEVEKCGREQNGIHTKDLDVCPAALPNKYDGINKGTYAGRFCWIISGTFCCGKIQGTYAQKLMDCLHCKFLKQVNEEEGRNFILTPQKAKSKSWSEA